jgi:hypothetical protein
MPIAGVNSSRGHDGSKASGRIGITSSNKKDSKDKGGVNIENTEEENNDNSILSGF